jgi:hypothetical protein
VLSCASGQETEDNVRKKGEMWSEVCRAFNLAPSTVRTITKNYDATKKSSQSEDSEADSAKPVRTLTVKSMQEAIALINKGCEIFCSNDPSWK